MLFVLEFFKKNERINFSLVISGCYAVEIFGTLGFSYTKRVADMKCTRPPQRFSEQVNHWKQRQRLFYVAAERLQFPQNESDLNKTAKPFEMIKGQKILKNNEVMKHINIWNRANYLSCHEGEPEYISENVEEREYEVMKTRDEDDEDSEYDEAEEEEFEEQDENAVNNYCYNRVDCFEFKLHVSVL